MVFHGSNMVSMRNPILKFYILEIKKNNAQSEFDRFEMTVSCDGTASRSENLSYLCDFLRSFHFHMGHKSLRKTFQLDQAFAKKLGCVELFNSKVEPFSKFVRHFCHL